MAAKKETEQIAVEQNPLRPPAESLYLYDAIWQMEMWLREMVYVELRARDPQWKTVIQRRVGGNGPPPSQTSDKRYRHMSTRHQSAISYLTTGQLADVIKEDANWPLFESYFQPKSIFDAKLDEVKQIRNRVAHFRAPHKDDLDRIRLFLKEIDPGIWKFCSTASCHDIGRAPPPEVADPISDYFVQTHDRRRVVEMFDGRHGWFYAVDRMNPRLGFDVGFSVRPWAQVEAPSLAGKAGVIFHASFKALHRGEGRFLAHEQVLKETEPYHENCLYIKLKGSRDLEVMVPSVLGEDVVRKTIESFLGACIEASSVGPDRDDRLLCAIADDWPEYVLPPTHPIGLLSEDTPCRMIYLDSAEPG